MKINYSESHDRITVSIIPETKQYIKCNFSRSGITITNKIENKYQELFNKARMCIDEIYKANKKESYGLISKKIHEEWKKIIGVK